MNKLIIENIGNLFDFLSETNLVEEIFYNHKGEYPVYSGQTEDSSPVSYIDSYNQTEPCVTFATYGVYAGKLFYREGKYTIGRNCMGLRPKEEFKEKINLQWFAYEFQNLFYRLRIGPADGQRSLNRLLLEKVAIIIPDKESIQNKQFRSYQSSQSLLDEVNSILNDVSCFLRSNMVVKGALFEEPIAEFFHIIGGNSGLTEDFVYYNLPNIGEDGIPILSGATVKSNFMGCVNRSAKPNDKKLKIFSGPAILVVRKGKAGQMIFIDKPEFTTNDDAYVLVLKEKWAGKINLRWFIYQYQELFYNLTTAKSSNATFNKEYTKKQKVAIPSIAFQNKIGQKLQNIDRKVEGLQVSKTHLENLIEYQIT